MRVIVAVQLGQRIDPESMFDVQIKRIHEYKRQLLNILETVARYNAIRANPTIDFAPRVKIFSGKAAASYTQAKLIIKLAIDVAAGRQLRPDRARPSEGRVPAQLQCLAGRDGHSRGRPSEQISTAGMEASGTGNMKMALNGALTIGTLDGANVELRDLVGDDNIFIFGLTASEVERRARPGHRFQRPHLLRLLMLREALDEISSGVFSTDDASRYRGLVDTLTHHDYFMLCADFDAYWQTQMTHRRGLARPEAVDALEHHQYGQRRLVFVRSGDRGVREEIWRAPFTPIG